MVRVDLEPYLGPIVLRRKEPPMSSVSFIGLGTMVRAIAARALVGGNAVELIGRDAAKAKGLAGALGGGATVGTFGAAPAGDIVVLAEPYSSALAVVAMYGDALAGKVIVHNGARQRRWTTAAGIDCPGRVPSLSGYTGPAISSERRERLCIVPDPRKNTAEWAVREGAVDVCADHLLHRGLTTGVHC
jgi:NADP oxidoreductase coenzyme F420-dependent